MRSEAEQSRTPREVVSKCWCSKTGRRFGLVFESVNANVWALRHSYLVNESYEEIDGRAATVIGSVEIQETYNGCKYCGDKNVFQCGECKAFNCQGNERGNVVRCGKCGARLELSGAIRSFSSTND